MIVCDWLNCKDDYSWIHVKEIPNTRYLVSLHHSYKNAAYMEIFDISKKGQAKKIYTHEKLSGGKNSIQNLLNVVNLK